MKNTELLSLYNDVGLIDRLHINIRYKKCPFEELEKYLPKVGRFLDFGCGHGLFANLLALKSHDRFVVGVDPDSNKIEIARKSLKGRANINFIQGSFDDIDEKDFAAITIMDVLYLIPLDKQRAILEKCRHYLGNNGMLMIKEVISSDLLRFKMAYFREFIMVKILRKTLGSNFYFRNIEEWESLLQDIGYKIETVKLNTASPSYLLLCRPE